MPSRSFHPEPRRPGERMGDDPPACRNMMEQEEDCGLLSCLGGWTGLSTGLSSSLYTVTADIQHGPPPAATALAPARRILELLQCGCNYARSGRPLDWPRMLPAAPVPRVEFFHGRSCSGPMCIHIPKATGCEARRMLLGRMRLPRQAYAAIGLYDNGTAPPSGARGRRAIK